MILLPLFAILSTTKSLFERRKKWRKVRKL
nr:MAG TPA: hypothetical protein [Caudoviricetes sp.]